MSTIKVLNDVFLERARQKGKWGEQFHPDGTSNDTRSIAEANALRAIRDAADKDGRVTWRHILREEVAEALCEVDRARLREELIQVAAVATAWVEDLDTREESK